MLLWLPLHASHHTSTKVKVSCCCCWVQQHHKPVIMSIEKYPQNILLPTVPSTHVCRHFLWCPALHVVNRVHDVYLRHVWQTAVTAFMTYIYVMQGSEGVVQGNLLKGQIAGRCLPLPYSSLCRHLGPSRLRMYSSASRASWEPNSKRSVVVAETHALGFTFKFGDWQI